MSRFRPSSTFLTCLRLVARCTPSARINSVPQVKHSKKLVSADNHSNIFNFHYTYLVTLVPVCKDDLVLLPKRLAEQLGNISRLVATQRVTSAVQFVDPLTAQTADVTEEKVSDLAQRLFTVGV